MQPAESVDVVLQDCRFVINRRSLDELLPDVSASVPPLSLLEFMDTTLQRTVLGYPLLPSRRLLSELFRLLVGELGRALENPDAGSDPEPPSVDGLRDDPYVRVMAELLGRAVAHGTRARLDSLLWLHCARVVAGILNHDADLLGLIRGVAPDDAAHGEQWLQDFLRLKGSRPAAHAAVKNRVLRALFVRNEVAQSTLAEIYGEQQQNALQREMVANRLVFTEPPDGLYSFFDARELFLVREPAIGLEDFLDLQRTFRSAIEDAWRNRGAGQASPAETWLCERYATDEVLEKAGRLELADAGLPAGGASDPEQFPARVAWLLSLQEEPVAYLFRHAASFGLIKSATRRHELRKDFLKRLRDPETLVTLQPGYRSVQQDLLRWDFFNTLRGFVRSLESDEGRLRLEGRALRKSVVALDLDSPGDAWSLRRYGTAAFLDLRGFTRKINELLTADGGEGAAPQGGDLAAFCIQRLLAVRRNIQVFRGQPEYFSGGMLLDLFPRALDALRYVALFAVSFERYRHVRPSPFEAPRGNPFAQDLRVGLGTGDWVEVPIPGGAGASGGGETVDCAVGRVLKDTERLVTGSAEAGSSAAAARGGGEEFDPLQVFRVRVAGNRLENDGICSFEQTFREIAAAVRLESLPAWSRAEPGGTVAGRRITLKNYGFELIFEDPATAQILLVRRVAGNPELKGVKARDCVVYEYLVHSVEAFHSFLDRAADAERHQPLVRRPRVAVVAQAQARPPEPRPGPLAARSGEEQRPRRRPASGVPLASDEVPLALPGEIDGPGQAAGSPPAPAARPRSAPAAPPEPAASRSSRVPALNLPGEDDFHFPDPASASAIEQRLGLAPGADFLSLSGELGAAGPGPGSSEEGGGADSGASPFDWGASDELKKPAAFSGPAAQKAALPPGFASQATGNTGISGNFLLDFLSGDGGAAGAGAPAAPPPPASAPRDPLILDPDGYLSIGGAGLGGVGVPAGVPGSAPSAGPPGPARPGPAPAGGALDGELGGLFADFDAAAGMFDFDLGSPGPASSVPSAGGVPGLAGGEGLEGGHGSPPSASRLPGSILGVLDASFAERIRALERGPEAAPRPGRKPARAHDGAATGPPSPSGTGTPVRAAPSGSGNATGSNPFVRERLQIARPDFAVLFKDYVWFWVRPRGASPLIAVGRRYRDVFFDLHRFAADPSGAWGPDDAIREFLRSKIRDNFVPQSLSYESLPDGAEEPEPLGVERLDRAFEAIT